MSSEEDISVAKHGEIMLSEKRIKKNCIIKIEFLILKNRNWIIGNCALQFKHE